MNIVNTYIVREILKGSLVALIVLLTLFNLFTFSDELKDIGKGDYQLREIMLYLALISPTVLYELMPASALLGSLFVMGSMANNRELVAMQAAGLSVFGIIKAILLAGLILAIIDVIIGEFIAPDTQQDAQILRSTAQNKQIVLQTRYGLWLREGNTFINIRQIASGDKMADINMYQLNDNFHVIKILHANEANFISNNRWLLNQVKLTQLNPERITTLETPEQTWESNIGPELLNMVAVSADNLSLYDLKMYVDFLRNNNQKSQVFELALWGRIVNPLVIFVMLLVSAPFVIGIKRGISVGSRIMIGVAIGMSFNVFDKITGHLGLIYDLNPALMAFLPSMLVLSIGLYTISRMRV